MPFNAVIRPVPFARKWSNIFQMLEHFLFIFRVFQSGVGVTAQVLCRFDADKVFNAVIIRIPVFVVYLVACWDRDVMVLPYLLM
jgi:hypothetical protein